MNKINLLAPLCFALLSSCTALPFIPGNSVPVPIARGNWLRWSDTTLQLQVIPDNTAALAKFGQSKYTITFDKRIEGNRIIVRGHAESTLLPQSAVVDHTLYIENVPEGKLDLVDEASGKTLTQFDMVMERGQF